MCARDNKVQAANASQPVLALHMGVCMFARVYGLHLCVNVWMFVCGRVCR